MSRTKKSEPGQSPCTPQPAHRCPFCSGPTSRRIDLVADITILRCPHCRKAGVQDCHPADWVSIDDPACLERLAGVAEHIRREQEIMRSDWDDPRWTRL
jgi:hypothetical protein